MASITLLINNMVCNRCVLAVENILTNELIPFQKVRISQVVLCTELSEDQQDRLIASFKNIGFGLIDNRNNALIEHIKQLVIRRARNEISEHENKLKLSQYISRQVNHEYTYLSSLFSSVEGRTIENLFIHQRVEKVKELLIYGQATLSQIAFELDYSSVAHLSKQFKKITGLTPSFFKGMAILKRVPLDEI